MTIYEFRRATQLTQVQFAELLTVHPVTVARWESGALIPRRRMMARIQQATGGQVTPADFYAGQDHPAEPAQAAEQVAA